MMEALKGNSIASAIDTNQQEEIEIEPLQENGIENTADTNMKEDITIEPLKENGFEHATVSNSKVEIKIEPLQENEIDNSTDKNSKEGNKIKTLQENEMENAANKNSKVDIKIEPLQENENENDTNSDATVDYDSEENVIVMNENTKFNARVKPDTSTFGNVCTLCDAAFRWPHQLKNHRSVVHEGKHPYTCKVCGKNFEHLKSFRDHKYVHTEERPYACKQCSSAFKMKSGLSKHVRDIHTETKLKFKCEYCSRVFKCKEKLVSHFLVHSTEKLFACNVCGKKFNRKNNLKEHVVIHSVEKNFPCPVCDMKFNRKYALKVHQRNHMEVRPYKCDFCEKSFSQSHALKSHVRLHTGERPYNCSFCERSFKQIGTLQVHEKRHTGEKNFKCGICERSFIVQRRLTEHMRVHTGEKPYGCDICPYKAATTTGLRCHKNTHERQLQRQLDAQIVKKLQNVFDEQDSINTEESVPTKSKQKSVKVDDEDVDSAEQMKSKRSKKMATGNKKTNGADSFVDGIQRTLKIKTVKKRKLKQSSSPVADKRLFNPMLKDDMTDTNITVINADSEVKTTKQPHLGQKEMLVNLLDKSKKKNTKQSNSQQQKNTPSNSLDKNEKNGPKSKNVGKHSKSLINLIDNTSGFREGSSSNQSLSIKALLDKGPMNKPKKLPKEKQFANALLNGPAMFEKQVQNMQNNPTGLVHDMMNNDLSLIDQAIANLAKSIGKSPSRVKVEPPDTLTDVSTNQAELTNKTDSMLGKVKVKLEIDTDDYEASLNPAACTAKAHSDNTELVKNSSNLPLPSNDTTTNEIPAQLFKLEAEDFGIVQS